MKKIFFASLAMVSLSLFSFRAVHENNLPVGSMMPKAEQKLKDISGKEVSLQDAKKENGLLVMFSCNSCPVVIRNQSRTNAICGYALDKKVGVIILNANE